MERSELIKKTEVESLGRRNDDPNQDGLHKALSDYAIQHAGTEADLDEELETATVEEAIEEFALSRAIEEGLSSPPAKRDDVMAILST